MRAGLRSSSAHRAACAHAAAAAASGASAAAEESARAHAEGFVEAAHKLVGLIEHLYEGLTMPKSDFSVSSLWK